MNDATDALKAFGEARAEWWKNPPRGQCSVTGCPRDDAILHETESGDLVCATHYADQADRDKGYPCDECGHTPAYRDPLHRRDEMYCNDCHARMGYVPGERAMVKKVERRVGVTHPLGRTQVCIAAGKGTECGGQKKQRSSLGILCDKHFDPVKWLKGRQG
jgi:hypothetical protein